MKIKLKSQLSEIPSYMRGAVAHSYIRELEYWGFKVANNTISGSECEDDFKPFVVLEFDSVESFLKTVKEKWSSVGYFFDDNLEDGMTFTLLNDPYPC